ncbi:MAG: hypothetical protein BJ554DRAFT_8260, partial [Olpidium bornovanus]
AGVQIPAAGQAHGRQPAKRLLVRGVSRARALQRRLRRSLDTLDPQGAPSHTPGGGRRNRARVRHRRGEEVRWGVDERAGHLPAHGLSPRRDGDFRARAAQFRSQPVHDKRLRQGRAVRPSAAGAGEVGKERQRAQRPRVFAVIVHRPRPPPERGGRQNIEEITVASTTPRRCRDEPGRPAGARLSAPRFAVARPVPHLAPSEEYKLDVSPGEEDEIRHRGEKRLCVRHVVGRLGDRSAFSRAAAAA